MRIINKPDDSAFQVNEPMLSKLIPDDGLLLKYLVENLSATKIFILSLSEDKLMFRYATGKWTIKEVIAHLIDMERIYTYRALCIARNDKTDFPGFDADMYVLFSGANDRGINELLDELETVRYSTITLLNGLSEEALTRSGTINGELVSAVALVYHIAGHELHHISIIKKRYFNN